ncbi:mucin-5AC-like isoform X1 [Acanthaster planci]|uniref:Mucin-5AC-like isoform X1 n=1 Tax=Acanthaster planci TaxID=133434 RepID=A0A8B7Z406_ACAPL|nr:mucin-5AC-like isoform X1 [Acanthaster planci]
MMQEPATNNAPLITEATYTNSATFPTQDSITHDATSQEFTTQISTNKVSTTEARKTTVATNEKPTVEDTTVEISTTNATSFTSDTFLTKTHTTVTQATTEVPTRKPTAEVPTSQITNEVSATQTEIKLTRKLATIDATTKTTFLQPTAQIITKVLTRKNTVEISPPQPTAETPTTRTTRLPTAPTTTLIPSTQITTDEPKIKSNGDVATTQTVTEMTTKVSSSEATTLTQNHDTSTAERVFTSQHSRNDLVTEIILASPSVREETLKTHTHSTKLSTANFTTKLFATEATTDAPTTQFSRGSTNYTCNSSNVATGTTPISVSLEDLLNKELGNISLEEGKEILEQAQSILDGENQVNQASHLVSLVDIYITVGNVDELQNATLEDSLSFVQTGISLANSLLRDKYTSFFKETSCSKPCNDSTSSPAGKIANTTEHLMLSLADKILERDGESFSSSSDNIGLYNSRFIVIPLIFMLVSHLICIGSLAV